MKRRYAAICNRDGLNDCPCSGKMRRTSVLFEPAYEVIIELLHLPSCPPNSAVLALVRNLLDHRGLTLN